MQNSNLSKAFSLLILTDSIKMLFLSSLRIGIPQLVSFDFAEDSATKKR